jgi:predicted enzyme related to lactoylglutathione lyase
MTPSVTHFEIYADDLTGLAQFYEELFGWEIAKAPGIDYFQIQTGPPEAGGIRGGMLNRPIPGPRSWVHYVSVDSLDESVDLVQRMGGEVGARESGGAKGRVLRGRGRSRGQHLCDVAGRSDSVSAARA